MSNTITADGKSYTLVYDFNTLVALEDEFGVTIDQLGSTISSKMRNVRTALRIGLEREHAEITDEEAGEILSKGGMKDVSAVIASALQGAFGQPAAMARGKRQK